MPAIKTSAGKPITKGGQPSYCCCCIPPTGCGTCSPGECYSSFTAPSPNFWTSHRDWAWPTWPTGSQNGNQLTWTSSPTPLSSSRDVVWPVCFPQAGRYKFDGFELQALFQSSGTVMITGIELWMDGVLVATRPDFINTSPALQIWQPEVYIATPGTKTFTYKAVYYSTTGCRAQGGIINYKASWVDCL